MSINRGVDNENVKHVHSGILLNSNIEYHLQNTEGPMKSDKERLTSYDITYVWNIIKIIQIDFLQNRSGNNSHKYSCQRFL